MHSQAIKGLCNSLTIEVREKCIFEKRQVETVTVKLAMWMWLKFILANLGTYCNHLLGLQFMHWCQYSILVYGKLLLVLTVQVVLFYDDMLPFVTRLQCCHNSSYCC